MTTIDVWVQATSQGRRFQAVAAVDDEVVWRGWPKTKGGAQEDALWMHSRLRKAALEGKDLRSVAGMRHSPV